MGFRTLEITRPAEIHMKNICRRRYLPHVESNSRQALVMNKQIELSNLADDLIEPWRPMVDLITDRNSDKQ